jgi:hypothetical protein
MAKIHMTQTRIDELLVFVFPMGVGREKTT